MLFNNNCGYDGSSYYIKKENQQHQSISKMIIYVDGSFNKDSGKNSWASVTDKNGNDLIETYSFLFTDLTLEKVKCPKGETMVAVCHFPGVTQQNNGAEMIGMLMGLRIMNHIFTKELNESIIYSDSNLMINHWSKGKVVAKTLNKMDDKKKQYIKECTELRQEFEEKGGQIKKVDGALNKADIGYH